jgi:uncharacterized protein YdiU (UPF0061 family)
VILVMPVHGVGLQECVEIHTDVRVSQHCYIVTHAPLLSHPAGVLNTDNMSNPGVTIDYGPYGFNTAAY